MTDPNHSPAADSRKADSQPEGARAQPDKFRDLARELGCDEDEARWDDALRKVAAHRPAPEPEKSE